MKKKILKNKIINFSLFCLLILLIIFIIYCFLNKSYENLTDFGSENIVYDAPIAYGKTMNLIKYPEINVDTLKDPDEDLLISIYSDDENILDPSHNVNIFRQFDNYYSNKKVEDDLKYFNNSTNLMLYHYNNDNNIEYITETGDNGLYNK